MTRVPVSAWLLLLQLLAFLAILVAVAEWSWPCALIVGGITTIVAVERQGHS